MKRTGNVDVTVGVILVFFVFFVVGFCMFGIPMYNVWLAGKKGEAELKQAEQNKQILIETARSKAEAAKFEADAETERARGVAKANEIIGQSLQENEMYLRYLWVQTLTSEGGNRTIIYVPTEGQLPILEAGRFLQ